LNKVTLFIEYDSRWPYFNLAAEEYLLHEFKQNVVFLYTNENSVVIGKHQNAFDECNMQFCKPNNVHIARRLSGGGTVFHGDGNLNFCFIQNAKTTDRLIDFKRHLTPVNKFLHSIGVNSEFSGRNDLLVDGMKISGNAEHVYSKKKRVIHHGTLLFNADLKSLKAAIEPKRLIKFKGHAVKSVRSPVANIDQYLGDMSYTEFTEKFGAFLKDYFKAKPYKFTEKDIDAIHKLMETKFNTWEWNFGYSPTFTTTIYLQKGELRLRVKKGIIESAEADLIPNGKISELIDKPYNLQTFSRWDEEIDFTPYF
jgi:lipoate-protein ligase A